MVEYYLRIRESFYLEDEELVRSLNRLDNEEGYTHLLEKIKKEKVLFSNHAKKILESNRNSRGFFREIKIKDSEIRLLPYKIKEDEESYYINLFKLGEEISNIKILKKDVLSDKIIFLDFEMPCYFTTICVEHLELDDNCLELKTLRGLREIVSQTDEGKQLINKYYNIAPELVQSIKKHKNKDTILSYGYQEIIVKAVDLTLKGKFNDAKEHYKNGIMKMYPLLN